MIKIKTNGAGLKKPQRSSAVGTVTEPTVHDRKAPAVAEATVVRKIKRRVAKLGSNRSRATRVNVPEAIHKSSMPGCVRSNAPGPCTASKLPASKTLRKRESTKCASSCINSQRYGGFHYPWWDDNNIQTYMELMVRAENARKKLPSSRTNNAKTISRTSEKHDLSVSHEKRHLCLKLLSRKRKTKIAPVQRICKFVNHRNRGNKKSDLYLSTVQYRCRMGPHTRHDEYGIFEFNDLYHCVRKTILNGDTVSLLYQ